MEANFKTYTGTKTIKAMPMGKAEAEKVLGKSITPATAGMDGYLVEYPDGYRSWSPKHVFENAYRIIKATRTINTFGAISEEERWNLKKQLNAMREYADVLYDRIRYAVEPRSVVSSESPCCSAGTKEGGE